MTIYEMCLLFTWSELTETVTQERVNERRVAANSGWNLAEDLERPLAGSTHSSATVPRVRVLGHGGLLTRNRSGHVPRARWRQDREK